MSIFSSPKKPDEPQYDFSPIINDNDDQLELWDIYTKMCYSRNPPIPALSVMKPILSGSKFSAKLAHYKIGQDLHIILDMLSQVKNISLLNLSDNALDERVIPHLIEFITSSDSLSLLNISQNPDIHTKGIVSLLEGFQENRSLETLDISNTGCSLIGKALAQVINNCLILSKLEVANCQLRQTGMDIANALPNAEKLKRLNLNKNQLHVGGKRLATALGSGAAKCPSLRKLYLSGNAINDDMASALLRALGDSSVLTVLDISCNDISEASGRAIANFITKCSSLKSIDISTNPILNVTINQIRGKAALENGDDKKQNSKDKKPKSYTPGVYLILNALAKNTSMVALTMYGLIADEEELNAKLEITQQANPNVTIIYRGPESKYFNPAAAVEMPKVDSSDDDGDDDED